MKKVVVKLEFADERMRQKAMKKVSGISGLESIAVDPKDNKMTITGNIDPVEVVERLRKLCRTEILSVGPEKEPEKNKEEPKKDGPKVDPAQMLKAYQAYVYNQHPYQRPPAVAPPQYFNRSVVEEDPNSCVIS